jgi:hypothetical protein
MNISRKVFAAKDKCGKEKRWQDSGYRLRFEPGTAQIQSTPNPALLLLLTEVMGLAKG